RTARAESENQVPHTRKPRLTCSDSHRPQLSVAHRHADRRPHREAGVLVQDARYSVPLARSHLEALEPRYPEGQELGYRHRRRGRHRRYLGHKPATTARCTRPEVAEIHISP